MRYASSIARSLLVIMLLCGWASLGWAQAPAWQTALATGGGNSQITATAADANGNVVVAGVFAGTISLGNFVLTSAGDKDLFVAKWNPASGFVWAQRAGSNLEEGATTVAVSGSNVYVAGYFWSQAINFGSFTLSNAPCGQPGGGCRFKSMFLAKLTDAGTSASFVWGQWTGLGTEARALAVNGPNVYVGGIFAGTAYFGSTTLTSTSVGGEGYLAKLTDAGPAGTFQWVRRGFTIGLNSRLDVGSVAVQGADVYLTGYFSGNASWGGTGLSSDGSRDVCVVKFTDVGTTNNFVWAQRAGGVQDERATAVVVSGANVYLSGTFQSPTLLFGTTTLTNANPALFPQAFVAKLLDAGASASFVWAQQPNGITGDQPTALAVRGTNVFLAGSFRCLTASFGGAVITNSSTGGSSNDVFVAKLLDAGPTASFVWAQQAGSTSSYDEVMSLTSTGTSVQVGGRITGPSAFGSLALPLAGAEAGFLATLTDPTLTAATAPLRPESIGLFPNPAHGTATVHLPAIPGVATATLTLLDALGRPVRTQAAAPGLRHQLALTGLAPGLYALRVAAGDRAATRRLVVE